MESPVSLKEAITTGITSEPVVETVTEKLERHVVKYLENKFNIAFREAATTDEVDRLRVLYDAIVKNS